MVKWRSHHPRNEPAPTRDVASVQRFVIQTANHLISNILANRPTEVEHDPSMTSAWWFRRAIRAFCRFGHGMLAAAKTRFRMSMSESELSAFEHGPIVAECDFASVESGPSTADLSLYNARVNRADLVM